MSRKAFIIGYYGSENWGDELILSKTIKMLNKHILLDDISALSYSVDHTAKHHGIRGVSRNHFLGILKEIIKTDYLVGGGGSMLQNVTSNRSLLYYLVILNLGVIFRKKVILLGNGMGPIQGKWQEWCVKKTLKKLHYVHLRDPLSYDWVSEYRKAPTTLGCDLAFEDTRPKLKQYSEHHIVINLRQWHCHPSFLDVIKQVVIRLKSKGYLVSLVSMQDKQDRSVLEVLGEVQCFNRLEDLMAMIDSSTLVLGMRLHALVLASMYEKPFIGLSYDPKVSQFCETFEQPYFEVNHPINEEELFNTMDAILGEYEDQVNKVAKKTQSCILANEQMINDIDEIMGENA